MRSCSKELCALAIAWLGWACAAPPTTGETQQALDAWCEAGCTLETSCGETCFDGLGWNTCGWWGICAESGLSYCDNICGEGTLCETTCVYERPGIGWGTTSCGNFPRPCYRPEDPPPIEDGGGPGCHELFQPCNVDGNCCSGSCSTSTWTCRGSPSQTGGGCTWDSDCSQTGWQRVCVGGVCQFGCRRGQQPPLPPC